MIKRSHDRPDHDHHERQTKCHGRSGEMRDAQGQMSEPLIEGYWLLTRVWIEVHLSSHFRQPSPAHPSMKFRIKPVVLSYFARIERLPTELSPSLPLSLPS